MIDTIKAKLKAFVAWVYNWITVLTGIIVGALAMLPDMLTNLTGIDFSPLVGAHRAAQIITGTAIAKAVVAVYQSKKAAK
jgi:preprotein translocase subunit SecY